MEPTYTDAELVAGVLVRDRRRIDAFVNRYTPLIQGAAARVLSRVAAGRSAPDLRDAVQEIFVRLWDKDFAVLRHFKAEQGTLGAYLWTVSYNATLRIAARAGGRELPMQPQDLTEKLGQEAIGAAGLPDVAAQASARSELAALFAELGPELDATDRALIERRFVEEQPSDLICAELRMSPAAFYQRISRLRRLIVATSARLSDEKVR